MVWMWIGALALSYALEAIGQVQASWMLTGAVAWFVAASYGGLVTRWWRARHPAPLPTVVAVDAPDWTDEE